MMYVCLGCYDHLEPIERECFIPCYDAPGGSVDSFDIEYHEESPLMDGLCPDCYVKKHPFRPYVPVDSDPDFLEDDDLPF